MKDTIQSIISLFVDNPKEVRVDEQEENGINNFLVYAASEDIGKIIGKEGKVIRALRNIMKIKAIKENKRIHISIASNEPSS